jgi:hypothetical protein
MAIKSGVCAGISSAHNWLLRAFLSAGLVLGSSAASAVVISLEDVTNGGGFFGQLTIVDNGSDTVKITADIADPINSGLTQGDILGLWFDFADFSALTGLPSANPMAIDSAFGQNSVGTQPFSDNNVNINGSGETDWDFAIQVGNNGGSDGFQQTVMFDLIITGLDESQFVGQRAGMRVQSIEPAFSCNEPDPCDSSKLIGSGPAPGPGVPAPDTLALLGVGALAGAFRWRRRRNSASS